MVEKDAEPRNSQPVKITGLVVGPHLACMRAGPRNELEIRLLAPTKS